MEQSADKKKATPPDLRFGLKQLYWLTIFVASLMYPCVVLAYSDPDCKDGNAYSKRDKWVLAIACYNRGIKADSNCTNCYLGRGIAYLSTGSYEQAEADFKSVLKLEPDNVSAHAHLGEDYHKNGQLKESISEYGVAIKLNPSGSLYYDRALTYADSKDYASAIRDYTKALESLPKKDRIWKSRAFAYAKLKQYDKAAADYTTSLQLCPGLVHALQARAECYLELHQYDKAIQDCGEALKSKPNDVSSYVLRAKIYKQMGQERSRRTRLETSQRRSRRLFSLAHEANSYCAAAVI